MYKVICVGTASGPTALVYLCLCHMDMLLQIVSCREPQNAQDHQTSQEQILFPIITFSMQLRGIMYFLVKNYSHNVQVLIHIDISNNMKDCPKIVFTREHVRKVCFKLLTCQKSCVCCFHCFLLLLQSGCLCEKIAISSKHIMLY